MPRTLAFPETMIGRVSFIRSSTGDAPLQAHVFRMDVRWSIADLDAFFDDPRHRVALSGRVRCEPLGGDLTLSGGTVDLFAVEPDGRMIMNYLLQFPAGNDQELVAQGAKQVVHDRPKDLWPDTTTLPIEVRQADGTQEVIVAGTLRLSLVRVIRAIFGMRANGSLREGIGTIIAFNRFFLAKLASVYVAAIRRPRAARTSQLSSPTGDQAKAG